MSDAQVIGLAVCLMCALAVFCMAPVGNSND